MVMEHRPAGPWVTTPPVLVAEVLSPSTRTEDTVRKAAEYAEGGAGQLWLLDPDARALDVFANAAGSWERLLRLDDAATIGEVVVGEHGVVRLDLVDLLPPPPPPEAP
jgi:hypothetical protein